MSLSAGPPHIVAHKHSENANENDKAVLVCECHSYPLATDWSWVKIDESGERMVRRMQFLDFDFCLA